MKQTARSGGWFLPVLTLVFVIAKLLGYISWSWWAVFSPLIVGGVVGVLALLFLIIVFLVNERRY